MPRGDKLAYTDKQKRKAEHIEGGYEDRGVSEKEAERRAWATVNKAAAARSPAQAVAMPKTMPPPKRADARAVQPLRGEPKEERSASAKEAAATRKRKGA